MANEMHTNSYTGPGLVDISVEYAFDSCVEISKFP